MTGAPPTPDGAGPGPRRPPRPPARRRRRWRRGLALLLLAALLAAGAAAWYLRVQLSAPLPATPAPPTVVFEVEPGWGASRVARELEAAGLVRDAEVFSLWLRVRELDRAVGEGLYDLSPAMDAPQVARALAAGGRPRTVRVVLPEGLRATEVAARLGDAGFDGEAFLHLATQPGELRPDFVPPEQGLEGFLFPAAYELPLREAPADLLARMLARFERELDADTRAALAERSWSVHEWVTLASLVQAEAADASEMPIVAGVFVNRLDLGMPLQSDPTVAYGLGKPMPELSAADGDLQRDHPWNTYTRAGLPAGPIGNPGRAALQAVLAPQRETPEGEPWLYFLHGTDDGQPVFRPNTNLDDHNRDVQRFLRGAG